MRTVKELEGRSRHPYFPHGLLTLLAFTSLVLYLVVFVRPYFILDYIDTPKLDFPIISGRQLSGALTFLGAFLALFSLYVLALHVGRRTNAPGAALLVLAWSVALTSVLALTHPIGANDIFGYAKDGELLLHFGANPLVFPATEFRETDLAVYSGFTDQLSSYGPLWTWIEAAVVFLSGTQSVVLPILGFKAIAVGAYLATAVLVYLLLRRRAPERAVAGLVFFAWNPLVLFEFAVNGHNDALMTALVLAGVLLWELRRSLGMILAFTAALLVKIPAILPLLIFLMSAARREALPNNRRFVLVVGALSTIVLTGLAYFALPQGAHALTNLLVRSDYFTNSLPTLMRSLLRPLTGIHTAGDVARFWATFALGLYTIAQLVRTWSHPNHALERAYDLWLFLLLFTTLWFQPWYVTWLIPIAALCPRANAPVQTALFSMTVTWSYIIGGYVWFWFPEFSHWNHGLGFLILAVAISFGLPWAYYVWSHPMARQRLTYVVKSLTQGDRASAKE